MASRPATNTCRRSFARALGALAVGLLTIISLAGCIKMDMRLAVKDDKVNGSVILAFDRRLLAITGRSEDELLDSFERDASLTGIKGVASERYVDDKYVGTKLILSDVRLDELAEKSISADTLRITHDKPAGLYRVSGAMDFSEIGDIPPTMATIMDSLDIRISITFPGEVIRHTGDLNGTTVTWRPRFGERTLIEAEAEDAASTPLLVVFAIAGSLLVALVVILIAVFTLLRRGPAPVAAGRPPGGPPGAGPPGAPPPGTGSPGTGSPGTGSPGPIGGAGAARSVRDTGSLAWNGPTLAGPS